MVLEPSARMLDDERCAREWLPRLQQRLRVEPGVEIEDKRYSLAIHYRRSRSKRLAHLLITLAVAELCPDARSIAGKQVVNVVPPGAPHKGIALERLREDTHTDTAIYVGDDVTDEDVFALDQPGRLLSIRIGKVVGSAAPYYLRRQAEIDHLLDLLIVLRPQPVSRRVEDP